MKQSSAPTLSVHETLVLPKSGTKHSAGPWVLLVDEGVMTLIACKLGFAAQ